MISLQKKIIIAIDGYSSCGKSSFAKRIARELDYLYLDSGAMYRSVALYSKQAGWIKDKKINEPDLIANLHKINISFRIENEENQTLLNSKNVEKEIRGVEVSAFVSEISKINAVRKHLVYLQQEMGKDKGIVMDGRDIGTVVFPDAEIKIFMVADPAVRTQRRYEELKLKGIEASLDEVAKNISERDYQDINRGISPLSKAADAFLLDNSFMTFDEQMDWFIKILKDKELLKI